MLLVSSILQSAVQFETYEKHPGDTSMANRLNRCSIFLIAFLSFPLLALAQQPPSSPINRLVPPAHGKIPVAFIIGRGAETIDVAGPWEAFQFANRPYSQGMS